MVQTLTVLVHVQAHFEDEEEWPFLREIHCVKLLTLGQLMMYVLVQHMVA